MQLLAKLQEMDRRLRELRKGLDALLDLASLRATALTFR